MIEPIQNEQLPECLAVLKQGCGIWNDGRELSVSGQNAPAVFGL